METVGEGNDNPLRYSWLENSMDRGAWQATVHGVIKSWTWLSEFHFTSMDSLAAQMVKHLPAVWETQVRPPGQEDPLEKEMATHSSTPRKFRGWRSLVGYSPWGRKESDKTDQLGEQSLWLFWLAGDIWVCLWVSSELFGGGRLRVWWA